MFAHRLFVIALCFMTVSSETETVVMTEENSIVVRGTITDKTADSFIYNLLLKKPEFVYIVSNGGSVSAGNRMVTQLKSVNVTCIAEKAHSMAFVLLQACSQRYVTQMATMMQHQLSLGVRGSLMNMNNYLVMVNHVEEYLNKMQADRIGMELDEFVRLVSTDWWIAGEQIIEKNVADKIVRVTCTADLITKNVTVAKTSFFGDDVIETYSACPLIEKPIDTKRTTEGNSNTYFCS